MIDDSEVLDFTQLERDAQTRSERSNGSVKATSSDGEPFDYVIIKSGKFVNCLARITSKGTANNRYNLQILTDYGAQLRRDDNALKSTSLVRNGFDVLAVPSRIDEDGQRVADMDMVTAELFRRRDELNLPDFTPSIVSKRSNASMPASALVGSPMTKSKLKVKGNTQDDTDGNSAEGDGAESRNNLYWADCKGDTPDGQSVGYACVWYGGSGTLPTDAISVLPIAPPVRSSSVAGAAGPQPADLRFAFENSSDSSAAGAPSTGSALSGVHASLDSHPVVTGGTKVSTGTASSSDSAATAEEVPPLLNVSEKKLRRLQRSDLQPLDDVLVAAKYPESEEEVSLHPNMHRHFLMALLEFAEWDYPQRDSYIWPDFIVTLMEDPTLQAQYLETASKHPLNNGARPLSDVILFLLCAEHAGLLDDWDDARFLTEGVCSDTLCSLLENLMDFKRTSEEIFRSVCRVADCFQAEVGPFSGSGSADAASESGVVDLTHSQSEPASEEASDAGEEVAYTPQAVQGREAEVAAYLEDVQRLRQKHLRVNQLIEAPLDLDSFLREWGDYTAAPHDGSSAAQLDTYASPTAPIAPPSIKERPHRQVLDDFIAHSRRQNKKLTALCTVKYIMSDPTGSAFSAEKASTSTASGPAAGSSEPSNSIPNFNKLLARDENEDLEPALDFTKLPGITATKSGITSPVAAVNVIEQAESDKSASRPGASSVRSPPRVSAPRNESVIVYYGVQELKVPIQYCRFFTVPDDQALEILHGNACDTAKALDAVAQLLGGDKTTAMTSTAGAFLEVSDSAAKRKAGRPPLPHTVTTSEGDAAINRCLISPTELDSLHGIVERYHNDLYKIHRKFNRYLAKQALRMKTINSEISSTDRAVGPYFFPNDDESPLIKVNPQLSTWGPSSEAHPDFTGNDPETGTAEYSVRSMQDILRLFFVLYPGFDDENFSIMTPFNSPLFRQWNQQSIASAVKNYPFGGNKGAVPVPPPNKKGSAGSNGKTPTANGVPAANVGSGSKPRVGQADGAAASSKKSFGGSNGFRMRNNPNLPNRWPKNLPLMQHNLYWIEMSSTPCLCTGLYIRGNSHDVQLNVISIHAEARRMQVAPNKVVPLYEDVMKSCTDDRSVAFAAALMLFAEWELETFVPITSMLRKWYVYPEFITQMLIACSRYLGWRKQADRNPRAATMSRRDNYLCALKEDYMGIPQAARNERFAASSLPWDDTPVSGGETGDSSDEDGDGGEGDEAEAEGSGGEGDGEDVDGIESIESYSDREQYERAEARRRSRKRSRKSDSGNGSGGEDSDMLFNDNSLLSNLNGGKKRSRPSDASEKSSRARKGNSSGSLVDEDAEPVGVKPPAMRSLYNMFWIPRSHLPCIYYDTPENRYSTKFRVIPICCVTYHYPFYVSTATKGSVEPLKLDHLKLITDERTSEFTHALIEFARKENESQRRAKLLAESAAQDADALLGATGMEFEGTGTEDGNDNNSLMDASMLQPYELFDWPAFLLDLINKPSLWHSWRKKAERAGAGLKRHQYLRALHAEHKENLEQENLLKKQVEEAASLSIDAVPKHEVVALSGPVQIRSHYNLFWLLRSNLPAIYYDTPENRRSDTFKVLPINCCQYQYPMKITKSSVIIEALSLNNLQHCTEDRTHDFTLALLDFAHWEQAERRKASSAEGDLYFVSSPRAEPEETSSAAHTWGSASDEDPNELYDWPTFILQMLNSPDKWSTWRKKAERSGRELRRVLYFKALLDDYRTQLASRGDSGTGMDTTH